MKTINQIPLLFPQFANRFWIILLYILISMGLSNLAFSQTVVWEEDFEGADALNNWSVSSGTWQIGFPASGPESAHSGDRCAATNLAGNYSEWISSHLISPQLVVPDSNENPRFRFWHWYSISGSDYGNVQIRVYEDSDGDLVAGAWEAISTNYTSTSSGVWTRPSIDLSAYAGKTVQIGFYFYSRTQPNWPHETRVSSGWYIDDVELVTGALEFNNPEDFENDLGDWYVNRGTWQVGAPTSGPQEAFTGDKVAATVLDGNYAEWVSSRLASPKFVVPDSNESPRFRFWHWYSISGSDYGNVQIRVYEDSDGDLVAGAWEAISTNYTSTSSGVWTRPSIDLSAYAGKTVQIGFYFYSRTQPNWPHETRVSSGWYIDDVELVTGALEFNNPEDFENDLGDWYVNRGTWQVGAPTSGPQEAFTGDKVAATVLDGNYAEWVSSRLASPKFVVPDSNESPRFRFWHWYSISGSDYGNVQIRVYEEVDGVLEAGAWEAISTNYTSTSSGVWTRPSIDLSAYAGKTVQIGFYFYSRTQPNWPHETRVSSGWYIDDVELVTGALEFNNPEDFENDLGDWYVTRGTWQVGAPTSGPQEAFTGEQVAATVLAGNYSEWVSSHLASPTFVVPAANESPRFRFWHWYSISGSDYGNVQIRVYEEVDGVLEAGAWEAISTNYTSTSSGVWTRPSIDLSAYAGKTVQIGFYFYSRTQPNWPHETRVSSGWYIDDVELVTGALEFNNPEDFENDLGDWYVTRGTWQVGAPTSGPQEAFTGEQVAATVLAGNYSEWVSSHLASPTFVVPAANESPRFRFWHWYSISGSDYGNVQIRVYEEVDGVLEAGAWEAISTNYTSTSSGVWTRPSIDLSAYAGKTVQIGFYFYSRTQPNWPHETRVSSGWYIDDVELVTGALEFNNPEDFENDLGDWYVTRGTWQVGAPTSGPQEAFTGEQVAATVLAGNYSEWVSSHLASPTFVVPDATVNPRFRFWHWYSISGSDYGNVQIRVYEEVDGVLEAGAWEAISTNYTSTSSGVWTRPSIDLSAYAGKTVQIGFYFYSRTQPNWPHETRVSSGWYIDNVLIESDTLLEIVDEEIDEGTEFCFIVPSNISLLIFSLDFGAPEGTSIDPSTGEFCWTPSEIQGPGQYKITILVHQDGNSLNPVDADTFVVTVNEVNDQPIIDTIGGQPVVAGEMLEFEVDAGIELNLAVKAHDPDNANGPFLGLIHSQDFKNPDGELTLEPWTAISLASDKDWKADEFGERTFAQIWGFNADDASDDWLISSVLDFTSTSDEFLTFETAKQFDGPDIEVLVSTDYDGLGDPDAATWTVLGADLSEGNEDVVFSGELDLSEFTDEENVYIAFHYTSAGTGNGQAPVWQVGDIRVKGIFQPTIQSLTFSLDEDSTALGATIDPVSGDFAWTPTVEHVPGPHDITVTVKDNGDPSESMSITFKVTVNPIDIDGRPVLEPIDDQKVDEEKELSFTASATDTDVPAQTLTFSIDDEAVALGATIDPETGEFSWTPSEEQGPGSYAITITVTDDGEPAQSDSETLTVTVNEVNKPPVLAEIEDKEVDEETELTFTATATDPDDPAQSLTFSIDEEWKALGAIIDPDTGEIRWTPPEELGPGSYECTITVTDDGIPPLSDSATIMITVKEVNQPPVLAEIGDKEVDEESELAFTATATDPDIPENKLTFSLDEGAPDGATIDPDSGEFSWTPTADQGSKSYEITVRVTDDGDPKLSDFETITVNVGGGECFPDLPDPVVTLRGTEDYEANGQLWTRYLLPVTNRSEFPDILFEAAPDLPPCGLNTNASRSWVNIFNGEDDSRIYGFCGFTESEHLDLPWFAVPRGSEPPETVYIEIIDRRCDITYRSNRVSTEPSVIPQLVSPADGAVLDNGRSDSRDDIVWDFEWSKVENATEYHLHVQGGNAAFPAIDQQGITETSFHRVSSGSFINDINRLDWTWKVRAKIGSAWGDWSEVRRFDVEPLNTDPPNPPNSLWAISPSNLKFGDVEVSTSDSGGSVLTVMLKNLSEDTLSVSAINTDNEVFTVADEQIDVEPGESVFVEVLFEPVEIGEAGGTLTIETTSETLLVPLHGAGSDMADRLDIDSVVVGELITDDIVAVPVFLSNNEPLSFLSWEVAFDERLEFLDFETDDSRVHSSALISADNDHVLITLIDFQAGTAVEAGTGFIGDLVFQVTEDITRDVIPLIVSESAADNTALELVDIAGKNGEIVIGDCPECPYSLDVDNDGAINLRDIIFIFRKMYGHSVVPRGIQLPADETPESVCEYIKKLFEVYCDGFAPLDVDMNGKAEFLDIIFIFRRMLGHDTVPAGIDLPEGVTVNDVDARIDCLVNK